MPARGCARARVALLRRTRRPQAGRAGPAARADRGATRTVSADRAHAGRGAGAQRAHRVARRRPVPVVRRAARDVGAARRRPRNRCRRQVPAVGRADPGGGRGQPGGGRGPRARLAVARGPRPRGAARVLLSSRRSGGQAESGVQLGRPRGPRTPARPVALDLRVPAPPRPGAVRVGLRANRRADAGAQGPVRRRVGDRQDDGGAGAGRRARPRPVPSRPGDGRLQVHRGDREEPRADLRGRGRVERDPVLRRGRRAVRQALGGLGLARPLRQHRGRVPAPADGGLSRAR